MQKYLPEAGDDESVRIQSLLSAFDVILMSGQETEKLVYDLFLTHLSNEEVFKGINRLGRS